MPFAPAAWNAFARVDANGDAVEGDSQIVPHHLECVCSLPLARAVLCSAGRNRPSLRACSGTWIPNSGDLFMMGAPG